MMGIHMWYGGARTVYDNWKLGYAVSLDGSSWQRKSFDGPVLDVGDTGQWDSQFVGGGVAVIMEDDILKMWYGGGNTSEGDAGKIGYAQSDSNFIIDGLRDDLANKIPLEPTLSQNYPNPFNPKTVINYELRITDYVNLSIYNILGQKVASLVDKKQQAGSYNVQWDASAFASGVYFYILETSTGLKLSKKLVLLK